MGSARRKDAAGQVGPAVACPASLLNDDGGQAAPPCRCPHAGPGARRERRKRDGGGAAAAAASGSWRQIRRRRRASHRAPPLPPPPPLPPTVAPRRGKSSSRDGAAAATSRRGSRGRGEAGASPPPASHGQRCAGRGRRGGGCPPRWQRRKAPRRGEPAQRLGRSPPTRPADNKLQRPVTGRIQFEAHQCQSRRACPLPLAQSSGWADIHAQIDAAAPVTRKVHACTARHGRGVALIFRPGPAALAGERGQRRAQGGGCRRARRRPQRAVEHPHLPRPFLPGVHRCSARRAPPRVRRHPRAVPPSLPGRRACRRPPPRPARLCAGAAVPDTGGGPCGGGRVAGPFDAGGGGRFF